MKDFKFLAAKYWNLGLLKILSKNSTTTKFEDGLIIHQFRQARFPSPLAYNTMGQETFDVALGLKGDVAIDVGCHVGAYAMRLARNFREVYAFEPNNVVFPILLKNLRVNMITNVYPERIAVSDRNGWHTLRIPSDSLSGTTLAEKHYSRLRFNMTQRIRTESLDSYFKGLNAKIGFVKIDVEGHELAVLNGMKNLIQQNPSMVLSIEIHRAPATLVSCDCEVCRWVETAGLKSELHGKYTAEMQVHWLICH